MTKALGRIGLALLLTVAAASALAQQNGDEGDDTLLPGDILLLPPDWWQPGSGNEGRQDVREATLPPPPSGPATPVPFCGPSDPICP
jgi:hypothetical protein